MRGNPLLTTVGLVLGLAAGSVCAQQGETRGGFVDYLTGQLAISDVDGFDNGLSLVVTGGKEMRDIEGLAIEGELTTTISKPEADVLGVTADISYWTLAGYGVYSFPVTNQFAVRGRLGVLYENLDIETSAGGDTDDELGLSFGVGATFELSPRLNAIAEYTRIEEDINHLSAGVQWKF